MKEVPFIRKEMQSSFRRVPMEKAVKDVPFSNRPQTILEVGTAVGFSTLLMCEYGPADLQITTIENYERGSPLPGELSEGQERNHRITFLTGDAGRDSSDTLEEAMI